MIPFANKANGINIATKAVGGMTLGEFKEYLANFAATNGVGAILKTDRSGGWTDIVISDDSQVLEGAGNYTFIQIVAMFGSMFAAVVWGYVPHDIVLISNVYGWWKRKIALTN